MINHKTLGDLTDRSKAIIAYNIFGKALGYRNFDMSPMLPFHELPEEIQKSWAAVASQRNYKIKS